MYDTQKMIESGRETMQRHPARELTAGDFCEMRAAAAGDEYLFAENAFMCGVAVGARITAAEQKKSR